MAIFKMAIIMAYTIACSSLRIFENYLFLKKSYSQTNIFSDP